ncbi:serine hydrolase [Cyanobacterium sp. DS4]|uniref:serine hydrolase n=1 Tax=Cyanobacterium sp. DS4 TaxID=2878255 RepID=UPI002E81C723|nr:serine hydrolase [Cyanobacterium sp. Dongsha4]WVL02158.1 class A beta-lactamase-related serine hydrolase [Cyanobacterium sp. Dongsha4]
MVKWFRRDFISILTLASAGTFFTPMISKAINSDDLEAKILPLFTNLPGKSTMKIKAVSQGNSMDVSLNSDIPLFCGSSFKVFVLTVFLRQMEEGKVNFDEELVINDDVRVLSSPVFGGLSGKTTALIALEAMMMHSDNTATDLIMTYVTPQAVREFITEIGLTNTLIPDSISVMFSYLLGAKNGEDWGWEKINQEMNNPNLPTRSIMNQEQSSIASSTDFVSFYSRALQGEFFKQEETLTEFKRILRLPAVLDKFIPSGAIGYVKGGSIDLKPQYALCLAGGVNFCRDTWAYYSFMINWEDSTGKKTADISNDFLNSVKASLKIIENAIYNGR